MRSDAPFITVEHPLRRGAADVANTYDMDSGPLAMPVHIRIGAKSYDGSTIENYTNQVEDYDVWLEDQIKAGTPDVLLALDEVYNKALGAGVILQTQQTPSPYSTHAHVVKRTIMALAR